jgi:hypothetical protein
MFYSLPDYLGLGGGCVIIDKEEDFPRVSIVGDHPNVMTHYDEWGKLFMEVVDSIGPEMLREKLESVKII